MKDRMALLVEIWGTASDDKRHYQVLARTYQGVFFVVVLEEIDHADIPARGRPAHISGPRMRVTFDVVVMGKGVDYVSALQNAWSKTVDWMKPKVKEDSTIMSLIEQGVAQHQIDDVGDQRVESVVMNRAQAEDMGWRKRLETLRDVPRNNASGMMVSPEMLDDVLLALDYMDACDGGAKGAVRH